MGNSPQGLKPNVEDLKRSKKAKEISVVRLVCIQDETETAH
jgi:hypothetical protein